MSDESEKVKSATVVARNGWQVTRADIASGFLVFLIALPLCLAIANASCFPPVAGVITAIVGGLVTPWISNSQLTIKGPAAGLIVIVAGCAMSFGWTPDDPEMQRHAYRCTLAIGVVAGVLQILFALLRTGIVSEFFPTSVVHGMLAAIGVIIISKQSHLMLGASPSATSPIGLLAELPRSAIWGFNPEIAMIGVVSLAVLFAWPYCRVPWLRRIPAPLIVVVLGILAGIYFDIDHPSSAAHAYTWGGHRYEVSDRYLVAVPQSVLSALTVPDFSGVLTANGLFWIAMFCLIGSLESILSAKAVDLLDPQKRRSDFNRDLLAVGVANVVAAGIGGLPMISEIVRSRANIDNGAQSRLANFFHGAFLLVFLVSVPSLIHRIPLAALAAMLVYTGFRLASPREFLHMYRVGVDQLVVFVSTIIGVLATDLLLGIAIGTLVKLGIHLWRGVRPGAFFRPSLEIVREENRQIVLVNDSIVFSSWLALRRRLMEIAGDTETVVDLSGTGTVDHSVLAKLHELQREWSQEGRKLVIVGLDKHEAVSDHPQAARLRREEKVSAAPTATKCEDAP